MNVDPKDCVYTPSWCINLMVYWLRFEIPAHKWKTIMDPFAGDGLLLDNLKHKFNSNRVIACEIRPEEQSHLCKIATEVTIGDFFKLSDRYKDIPLIVTNPPYRKGMAEDSIRECVSISNDVVALLPLSFLGTQNRSKWISRSGLRSVGILTRRPSFRMSAFAMENHTGVKWGTNNQEYGWFWWHKHFCCDHDETETKTTICWLEE